MRDRTILLAEDSENDIELTLAALAEHVGNKVDVARDGAEVLDYLYRRGAFAGLKGPPPVLVMLDLKMPKVDGLEVLRVIKADPTLRWLPVVVLTSSREQSDVVKSYELGVNAYVVKPVEFEKFVEAVKQLGLFWLLVNEPPPVA
jgi:CheY-like chemotaxis protein